MATPARVAGVGVFVVGGLLLFAVRLFMVGDRQMAFAKKVTLYTEFKKITGLQPGAVVRVSAAKAGSITQILPPDAPSGKFLVEVEIIEDLHQLVRTDSLATIETEGLVGGNYLGITTGSDAAPIVAPNTAIAGKEPLDIAELVQRMGDTVTKVNDTVDDMRDDVQRAVVAIADTAESANSLISGVTGEVTKIAASRCADHRRCRADRRWDSQRQRHHRQTRQRRRAVQPRQHNRKADRRDHRIREAAGPKRERDHRESAVEGWCRPGDDCELQADDGRCARIDGGLL
jgi:ABC-type transporter Mla subunit MlaD